MLQRDNKNHNQNDVLSFLHFIQDYLSNYIILFNLLCHLIKCGSINALMDKNTTLDRKLRVETLRLILILMLLIDIRKKRSILSFMSQLRKVKINEI